MKNYINASLLTLALFLISCSGSDVYQGKWKATDTDGNKLDIDFKPKSFTIKDTTGKVVNYEYTQNSVKIENSVKTYGIQLNDGRTFDLFFPIANDASKAIMTIGNNVPIYTISRTSYIKYKDLYKLTK